jgi:hypothetical protein
MLHCTCQTFQNPFQNRIRFFNALTPQAPTAIVFVKGFPDQKF